MESGGARPRLLSTSNTREREVIVKKRNPNHVRTQRNLPTIRRNSAPSKSIRSATQTDANNNENDSVDSKVVTSDTLASAFSCSSEKSLGSTDVPLTLVPPPSAETEKLRISLGARFEELLRLTRMYQSLAIQNRNLEEKISDVEVRDSGLRAKLNDLEEKNRSLEEENSEMRRNLSDLAALLGESRESVAKFESELQFLTLELKKSENYRNELSECFHTAVIRTHTREILRTKESLLRNRLRLKRINTSDQWSLLKGSWLFDAKWYLLRYPDVAQSKWDPVEHYLRFGAREGRDPSPHFCTSSYMADHIDVAESGINPLVHYIKFGCHERRLVKPA